MILNFARIFFADLSSTPRRCARVMIMCSCIYVCFTVTRFEIFFFFYANDFLSRRVFKIYVYFMWSRCRTDLICFTRVFNVDPVRLIESRFRYGIIQCFERDIRIVDFLQTTGRKYIFFFLMEKYVYESTVNFYSPWWYSWICFDSIVISASNRFSNWKRNTNYTFGNRDHLIPLIISFTRNLQSCKSPINDKSKLSHSRSHSIIQFHIYTHISNLNQTHK